MTDIDTKALALRVADNLEAEAANAEMFNYPAVCLSEATIAEARALAAFLREAVARTADADTLKKAVSATTDATASYLPPDGIDASECISRILAATDNPEINAIMLEKCNVPPQD